MLGKTAQKSLFEAPEVSNDSRLFSKNELIKFDRNLAVAFGVTKTGLNKGSYGVLENIFCGMRNIEIPLEMLSIENPGEILLNYYATDYLKKRGLHLSSNIPRDFLKLVKYINSFKMGFDSLANKFKKCFNIKQEERFELLDKNIRDRFVESFFTRYKSSFNHDFDDPNIDGRSKEVYINIIYNGLESLSERFKKSQE
jgi:hypothetical protein